jgi:NADPH2:quinone reductase
MMKALRVHEFGGPQVLKIESLPDPRPAAGQVLVRVKAVGVNPVDTYIRNGAYAKVVTPPYTPHSDAAGLVEAVGEGVTRVKAGDRVFITGTTSPGFSGAGAELALSREVQVHALAPGLSFAQGAALYIPYGTAWRSLFHRARGQAGETVLVHGASGGVGLASVQIARASGLTVIGTAGTSTGRDLVLAQGAHHALDHSAPGYLEQLAAITGGRGVDVILEMASHLNLAKDLQALARYGRIVIIGCRGPIEINPREAMARDAAILGMHLANASEADAASIWAGVQAGLANGTLRPVIGREFPLEEVAKAHEAVMAPGAHGKIVLTL